MNINFKRQITFGYSLFWLLMIWLSLFKCVLTIFKWAFVPAYQEDGNTSIIHLYLRIHTRFCRY